MAGRLTVGAMSTGGLKSFRCAVEGNDEIFDR